MLEISYLVKRNTKIFFKDRGMFITSLITPLILLVLYATFLAKVYKDVFVGALPEGIPIDETLIAGTVGGQLLSSLLAVSCITVAFCSNLLMVNDKLNGALRDLTMTPVKSSSISLGYFISTALVTLIISYTALFAGLVYLAFTGWYLSLSDVVLIILDVFLLVLFGTALSSIINCNLSTAGQASAVGTIVSAGYGFICGAYMPISNFNSVLQKVVSFLPGTYGTSLLRNHSLNGVFSEMSKKGYPAEVIDAIRDSIDCNIYFFDNKVEEYVMYLILTASVLLILFGYVVLRKLRARKNKQL